jgi:hypothetical protein
MRFSPDHIELTTQSECKLVSQLALVMPREDQPHGEADIFEGLLRNPLHPGGLAIRSIVPLAQDLGERVHMASRQPDIIEDGYRKAGTVGQFRPFTIRGRDLGTLRTTALLVATRDIPEYTADFAADHPDVNEWHVNAAGSTIRNARLLGLLMVRGGAIGPSQRLLETFTEQLATPAFMESIAVAAQGLITATRREHREAAQGVLGQSPFATEHDEADRLYEAENPLIFELAAGPQEHTPPESPDQV